MKPFALPILASGLIIMTSHPSPAADPVPFSRLGRWIDLTHSFSFDTLYWPTSDGFALEAEFKGIAPGGYFYSAYRYRASEHGGTHVDAPIHFAREGQAVDQVPLERLIGPAAVVDVSAQASADPNYQVSVADLQGWEEKHQQRLEEVILLIRTGYARHWPNALKYLGTDEKGPEGVAKLQFPGIHPDAARWLVDHRRIRAVGIDTASIDYGKSTLFETHRILFEKNIPALENVASMDELPAVGAWLVALPMKIRGGSGGPLRVVAWISELEVDEGRGVRGAQHDDQ